MSEDQRAQYEGEIKKFDQLDGFSRMTLDQAAMWGCEHADTVATNRTLNQVIDFLESPRNCGYELGDIVEQLKKLRK